MSTERDEELIEKTVTRTLERFGVDVENPREQQEDFVQLRQWRKAKEQVKTAGVWAFLTVVIPGVIALLILGIQGWFKP